VERTIFIPNTLAHSNARLLIRIIQAHRLCELNAQPVPRQPSILPPFCPSMHSSLPPSSHSSSQRSEWRDKPISDLLRQLRVAIARKQLDGIRRHLVCLSILSLNPSILNIFPVCMYPFPLSLLSLFSFEDANWFLARVCCKTKKRKNELAGVFGG
jgi:hypothetical protein